MLAAERQQNILDRLDREGRVLAAELASSFNVSEDTIRRDLRDLADAGLLQRVHGGALKRTPASPPYTARLDEETDAKAAIARAAAALVRPGNVVFLDGGTTALHVARHLPRDIPATVLTNSPPNAVALAEHPRVEVYVVGGRLLKVPLATAGAETVRQIEAVRADLFFLSVCSLDADLGITVFEPEEAPVKRAMLESAAETVALVTAAKLGTAAPFRIGAVSDLTHLVVEAGLPDERLEPYRRAGVAVIQA